MLSPGNTVLYRRSTGDVVPAVVVGPSQTEGRVHIQYKRDNYVVGHPSAALARLSPPPPGTAAVDRALGIRLDRCVDLARALAAEIARRKWQLEVDKQRLQQWCQAAAALNEQQHQCRYLDVGGTRFHTSAEVMQREFGGGPHVLSVLASDTFASELDSEGYTFIDRDGHWFPLLLEYLREGTVSGPLALPQRNAVRREAQYYGLEGVHRLAGKRTYFAALAQVVDQDAKELVLRNVDTGQWERRTCPDFAWNPCCGHEGRVYVVRIREHTDEGPEIATGFQSFDPATGTWSNVTTFPVPAESNGLALHMVAQRVVHFGSSETGEHLLHAFHLVTGEWQRVPYPPVAEADHEIFGSCVIGDQWLVFSGHGCARVPVAGIFASPAEPWVRIPSVPMGPRNAAVVAFEGKAVVFGHMRSPEKKGEVVAHAYDPVTSAWSPFPAPPGRVWGELCAMAVDDTLMLVSHGDRLCQTFFATFSAATGEWTTERMPAESPRGWRHMWLMPLTNVFVQF